MVMHESPEERARHEQEAGWFVAGWRAGQRFEKGGRVESADDIARQVFTALKKHIDFALFAKRELAQRIVEAIGASTSFNSLEGHDVVDTVEVVRLLTYTVTDTDESANVAKSGPESAK